MNDLVLPNINREVALNSQEIASLCDKRHDNVLRDIREICQRLNIDLLRFEEIYFDTHGREQKRYSLDKRYALTLVSGYDIIYRDKIAKRIVDMEELTPNEFLFCQAANMLSMERTQKAHGEKLGNHEAKLSDHDKKIKKVEDRLATFDSNTGFLTVLAYGRRLNYRWSRSTCQALGRRAATLCRQRHIQPGRVSDEKYDSVGSYPIEILDEVISTSSELIGMANQ